MPSAKVNKAEEVKNLEYSVCVPAVLGGLSPRAALRIVREAGFSLYEIWSWWDQDLKAVGVAQAALGLAPVAMCTRFIPLNVPEKRDAFVEGLRDSLAAAERLSCPLLIAQVGQAVAGLSREAQHKSIVEGLRACVPLLQAAERTLVIEPLNTRVDHKGYYLEHSDEGFDIVRTVDSPYVKLLFDVYHQQISEGDLLFRIRENAPWIGHPGRHEPYEHSEVYYPEIVSALGAAGYDGAIGLEYFPLRDPDESLRLFREKMPKLP